MKMLRRGFSVVVLVIAMLGTTSAPAHAAPYPGVPLGTYGAVLEYTVLEMSDSVGWMSGVLRDTRVDGLCAYVKFERLTYGLFGGTNVSKKKVVWVCDVWGYRTRRVWYSTYTAWSDNLKGIRITVGRLKEGTLEPARSYVRRDLTRRT